ncbi:hypothetical protein FA13DRAFT_1709678 [Coprinellus micaceus]|uniref:Uncharacterized protein n=1 Tax=Coprinellus micaceus TaxID=71717 RepID=A0A4Y7TAR4_COPMI|nr:hypothetical protein FA13DRAFT_1709678 [Coprinellus micaceus]
MSPSKQTQGLREALFRSAAKDVPNEVLTRIAYLASQSLRDVWALFSVCAPFRHSIMPTVIWEIIYHLLSTFGLDNPRMFLVELQCVGGVVGGPTLLSAFSPTETDALAQAGFTNRLEIHIPSTLQAVRVVKKHLASAGYNMEQELDNDDAVGFAGVVLGYQDFGRTVPKVINYERNLSSSSSQACTVFVNASPHSALTGVLELPTTLFMIYIEDGNLNLLYPHLSLRGKGLINAVEGRLDPPHPALQENFDGWDADAHKTHMDWFVGNMQSTGFDLKRSLNHFPEFANHQCKVDSSCPATERRHNDGQELRLPYAGGKSGPSSTVAWNLKASWSCVQTSTRDPSAFGENVPQGGRYVVGDQVYRDTPMYWETGDEYGLGWFLKATHLNGDLEFRDCDVAETLLAGLTLLDHV